MFDTLDTIDWSSLETAYGTAEAIPGALRDLASPDEEVRATAWQTLWSELEHQGTVYQASAYAAPFLVCSTVPCGVASRGTGGRGAQPCHVPRAPGTTQALQKPAPEAD